MSQIQIFKLNCISCNGNLEISPETNKFACGFCGTQQFVERKGGMVQLKEVVSAINRVQTGTDKTAAELALQRLVPEVAVLEKRRIEIDIEFGKRLEIKRRELALEIEGHNRDVGLTGCFIVIVSFVASLMPSFVVVALVQAIFGVIYSVPTDSIKISFWFILILALPLFYPVYRFLSKVITNMQSSQFTKKNSILEKEIASTLKSGISSIQEIDLKLADLRRKIEINRTTADS